MSFIIIVVGLIMFFHLLSRVNSLEKKVEQLSKGSVKAAEVSPAQTMQAPAAPLGAAASMILDPNVAAQAPVPPPQPTATPKPAPAKDGSTEFAVGSKILTGVGVVALILGVTFFLRYAFENDLISEGGRVVIGVIFGLIMVAAGHMLRKKYEQYGSTIIGAGLGILYLSVYAAYGFYSLIGLMPAFILLCLITAGGVALALSYNSKALVGYAFVGAFIIPFLLPLAQSVHTLFMYLLILNVGVLLVARFKVWPEFTMGSLVGTCLLFLQWVYGPYSPDLFVETMLYITVIFVIYYITSLLNFLLRDRDYKGVDGMLLYGIPVAYFLLMLTIVSGKNDIAILAGSIGLFYVILSTVVRVGFGHLGELTKFSNATLCVATPFIALATVLYFDGSTITIMWALEAVVMVLIGYLLNTRSNRIAGIILLGLAGLRTIGFELRLPSGSDAFFNSRAATFFFVAAAFLVVWKMYNSYVKPVEGDTVEETRVGRGVSAIGLYIVLFVWVSLETASFVTDYALYLPVVWLLLVIVMMSLGTMAKESIFRNGSYLLILLSALMAFIAQSGLPSTHMFLANVRVGTVILAALVVAYVVWLFKTHSTIFTKEEQNLSAPLLVMANGLVLWAFSLEILSYFNMQKRVVRSVEQLTSIENTKRVALSAFWLAYALAGLGVGIFRRSSAVRYASIILFAFTVFKIFLYDTANLSDVYRFVSFIVLGVILLIAGFAYYRFKNRIMEFVSGESAPVAPASQAAPVTPEIK